MHSVVDALRTCNAHRTFLLGESGKRTSRASGVRVDAEHAACDIRRILSGSTLVLLVSAFGGAVGTGASPVVARIAKELGIPTVALVSMPFNWEGSVTHAVAAAGLELIASSVDLLMVISSDTAMDLLCDDDLTMDETINGVNDVLALAAAEMLELLLAKAPSRHDYSPFHSVRGTAGMAMFGTAMAGGLGRAKIAAEQAIVCGLLEGVAFSEAQQAMVMITAAPGSLTNSELKLVMDVVRRAAPTAQCSFATATVQTLADQIRVSMIGVGLQRIWMPEDRPLASVASQV